MSNKGEADLKESLENLLLITGGAKSGKSSLAEEIARQSMREVFFIATMPELKDDPELTDRIGRHRKGRPADWTTIEEPVELETAIESIATASAFVLIDCLSLFVSNLMLAQKISTPESLVQRLDILIDAIANKPEASFIIVTNEVGCSVVPDNPLARRYRDLLGLANKSVAQAASTVHLCVSGLTLTIKDEKAKKTGHGNP